MTEYTNETRDLALENTKGYEHLKPIVSWYHGVKFIKYPPQHPLSRFGVIREEFGDTTFRYSRELVQQEKSQTLESEEQNDGTWAVKRATQSATSASTASAERRENAPATRIQPQPHNGARSIKAKVTNQPYTDLNPITDTLMPLILILCVVLAFVTLSGAQTLSDVPIIPCVVFSALGLVCYGWYRTSPVYEQAGRAFEKFMRATHDERGRISKANIYDVLSGKAIIEEDEGREGGVTM